jgi:outer membrane protein assembly factor BamB
MRAAPTLLACPTLLAAGYAPVGEGAGPAAPSGCRSTTAPARNAAVARACAFLRAIRSLGAGLCGMALVSVGSGCGARTGLESRESPVADSAVGFDATVDATDETFNDGAPEAARADAPDAACGQTLCGTACVDPSTDRRHCGECGHACDPAQACVAGACLCASGGTSCGSLCTDPLTDSANCGGCGRACGAAQSCKGGACACPTGTTACGADCVDTSSDSLHCGGCGTACAREDHCERGVCTPPGSVWRMVGADGAHTGSNSVERGVPPLSKAWSAVLSTRALSPVVVEGGRVIAATPCCDDVQSLALAFSAADGTELWRHEFGHIYSLGLPTIYGGTVYVAPNDGGKHTGVSALDAGSGSRRWSLEFDAQWDDYWSPLTDGERVYFACGSVEGLCGALTSNGSQLFFNEKIEQYDQWSPALARGKVWTYIAGILRGHDPLTGDISTRVALPWTWTGWNMKAFPVFDAKSAYVIAPPSLYAIDPAAAVVRWKADGAFKGSVAVDGGVVFALGSKTLHARDAATGGLLWTFTGDGALKYPPAVAAGYVYVSSDTNVYAVDIATHVVVWSAPVGGWLSIAEGRLFVAQPNGVLQAYALSSR